MKFSSKPTLIKGAEIETDLALQEAQRLMEAIMPLICEGTEWMT